MFTNRLPQLYRCLFGVDLSKLLNFCLQSELIQIKEGFRKAPQDPKFAVAAFKTPWLRWEKPTKQSRLI